MPVITDDDFVLPKGAPPPPKRRRGNRIDRLGLEEGVDKAAIGRAAGYLDEAAAGSRELTDEVKKFGGAVFGAAKVEGVEAPVAESKDAIYCIEGFERRIWIGRPHLDGDEWVIESAVQVRFWEAPKSGLPGVLLYGPKTAKQLMLDPCPVVRVNVLRVVNRYELDEKLWAEALVRR